MNGPAYVKLWDGAGQSGPFLIHRQDQLHKHQVCCGLGTMLDADCGPGDRGCRGGGGREGSGKVKEVDNDDVLCGERDGQASWDVNSSRHQ